MSRAAVLAGLGGYLPPRVVANDDIATLMDTDDVWIRNRTGIRERRWADRGTTTADLAEAAGKRALASASIGGVDQVIMATSTPNHPMPPTAPQVAERLGLRATAAFDISAACSGFLFGLAAAAGAIAIGVADTVLVIGADLWSTRLNPADRGVSVIFGDGAGAAVVRAGDASEPGALLGFDLGSDGENWELAQIPGDGSRELSTGEPRRPDDRYLVMVGKEMFNHAVRRMATSAERLLATVGWSAADVDRCVAHQANARILNAVADAVKLDRDRMIIHLDRVGNTSAASIPLALTEAASSGRLTGGDRVLMTAFGGGLTWASSATCWPALDVSGL
jgi:3-oxoacyl-[acyl-carrier-protein] synthase-3